MNDAGMSIALDLHLDTQGQWVLYCTRILAGRITPPPVSPNLPTIPFLTNRLVAFTFTHHSSAR